MGLPTDRIPIEETFVSIQGEGLNIGVPYVFVRVGGCPLRCRFCDQESSWHPKSEWITSVKSVSDWVLNEINRRGLTWISITGGEPMLYPEQLKDMMLYWRKATDAKAKVHIETSGRFFDEHVHGMCDLWSMDIKTPCTNEVNADDLEYLKHMRSCDQVKCLIESGDDLNYARRVHKLLDGKCSLVLQPFNINPDNENSDKTLILLESYQWLVESVLKGSYAWSDTVVAPQLHVLIFGNTPCT